MNVGILGLGLIGGSMARAYALEGHTVYATQRNEQMLQFAMMTGAVHGKLDEETIPQCDLILLAIYPGGCVRWLEANAHLIRPETLVMDGAGIKREICEKCFPLAEQYGFTHFHGMLVRHQRIYQECKPQCIGYRFNKVVIVYNGILVLLESTLDEASHYA